MKKVYFINDTRSEMHAGSFLTTSNLISSLAEHGVCFVGTISEADVIIVNGEGSLHEASPTYPVLMREIHYALKLKKEVAIVNATIRVTKHSNLELLSRCKILTRDTFTQQSLKNIVEDIHVGCDFIFMKGSAEVNEQDTGYIGSILFTDSIKSLDSQDLYNLSTLQKSKYVPMWYVYDNGFNFRRTARYLQQKLLSRRPFYSFSREEIIHNFRKCEKIVTGRYHAVCMAVMFSKQFSYIPSNTNKIEALLDTLNVSDDLILSDDDLIFKQLDWDKIHSRISVLRGVNSEFLGNIAQS